jgi:hypothetical protein
VSKFSYKKIEELSYVTFYFEGSIDESFSTFNVKPHQNKGVKIDFAKVTSINSIGIRNWISWVSSSPGISFTFLNCPVCVVEQINNVKGFIPENSVIESFFVPYYSEHTGEEKHELYKINKDFQPGKTPVVKPIKDSTGKNMDLDVYPQKYFKFLLKGV